MKNPNKPNVILHLTREHFNSLMSTVAFFVESKNQIGETCYSEQAEQLKEKIIQYGVNSLEK